MQRVLLALTRNHPLTKHNILTHVEDCSFMYLILTLILLLFANLAECETEVMQILESLDPSPLHQIL